ncbi:MAG: dTMP kinase [Actinobacteria bacterium]|nr:dTMP kinase [Actinomycetota bacterium]MCL5445800.1 dTMP kinase [Actinomycetota bacterium]
MGGLLIALEGIDGSGKSTQAGLLARSINASLTFEPGATHLGIALRSLLLHSAANDLAISTSAEALLMIADRAQDMAENILPALSAGNNVVTDRYSASTIAYQGYGRGIDVNHLQAAIDLATGGLSPALNVLLDLPVSLALERLAGSGKKADRFEEAGVKFLEKVRTGYLSMAAADPSHWMVIDSNAPADQLAANILEQVKSRLEAHL